MEINKKHLLVAATELEMDKFTQTGKVVAESPRVIEVWPHTHLLITGIGSYNALYSLMRYINEFEPPHEIINVGICGSFKQDIKPGTLVNVLYDTPASHTVEEDGAWFCWKDAGLPESEESGFYPDLPIWADKLTIQKVQGITTDFITNEPGIIKKRKDFFKADVESMEGAGILFVAQKYKIKSVQIRCVSNYVGERNKKNWKLNESIGRLNNFLQTELKQVIT